MGQEAMNESKTSWARDTKKTKKRELLVERCLSSETQKPDWLTAIPSLKKQTERTSTHMPIDSDSVIQS